MVESGLVQVSEHEQSENYARGARLGLAEGQGVAATLFGLFPFLPFTGARAGAGSWAGAGEPSMLLRGEGGLQFWSTKVREAEAAGTESAWSVAKAVIMCSAATAPTPGRGGSLEAGGAMGAAEVAGSEVVVVSSPATVLDAAAGVGAATDAICC